MHALFCASKNYRKMLVHANQMHNGVCSITGMTCNSYNCGIIVPCSELIINLLRNHISQASSKITQFFLISLQNSKF